MFACHLFMQAGVGAVQIFILGWLNGACLGGFHDVFMIKESGI
jgi:hypothetical protein